MQLCLGVKWEDAEEGGQEDSRAEEQDRAKPNLKTLVTSVLTFFNFQKEKLKHSLKRSIWKLYISQ